MNSVKAQIASGLLPTFLYSFLHVNDAQNAIVVTAPSSMLAVEVASTDDLTAGLQLSYTEAEHSGSTNSNTGDVSYSTVGTLPADFKAKLNALITKGKANVRATPRMAAINGHSAGIFIGETKFIKVKVTSYGGEEERIQGVDVGVKLNVLPWTGGNGEITVYLEPEVSNISELDRDSGLPVLSTRRASTTVRVKDGETVMIGGLVQKQEYETRRKIPILGDLPLFGPLFQSKSTSRISSELVIFVTPHILTANGQLKDSKKEDEIRERLK
jgi:type IV pilus assembly protein PilQ